MSENPWLEAMRTLRAFEAAARAQQNDTDGISAGAEAARRLVGFISRNLDKPKLVRAGRNGEVVVLTDTLNAFFATMCFDRPTVVKEWIAAKVLGGYEEMIGEKKATALRLDNLGALISLQAPA